MHKHKYVLGIPTLLDAMTVLDISCTRRVDRYFDRKFSGNGCKNNCKKCISKCSYKNNFDNYNYLKRHENVDPHENHD